MSQNKKRHYDKKGHPVPPIYEVVKIDKKGTNHISFYECKDKDGYPCRFEASCRIEGDIVSCVDFMMKYLEFHDDLISKNDHLVKLVQIAKVGIDNYRGDKK